MKKQTSNLNQFIFAIYAEDKKGLVGHIMFYFNRSCYVVNSINVSRTDINDLVLITIEAELQGHVLTAFTEKIKKIVEVYTITTYPADERLKKTGFYRLAAAALNAALLNLMTKYGAIISSVEEKSLVISKTGSDKDLSEFYTLLEGPNLLSFCKSGLIVDESLVPFENLC